jgi:hypothetical protein
LDDQTKIGESDSAAQQREAVRDSMFLHATVSALNGTTEFVGRVRNLSAGGMMVETPVELAPGEGIACELRGIGRVDGRVAWSAEGRLGIAFDAAIDPRQARRPIGRQTAEVARRPLISGRTDDAP